MGKSFTDAELDAAFADLQAKCVFVPAGKTKAQCCAENGVQPCPPDDQPSHKGEIVGGVILTLLVLAGVIAIRRRLPQRAWEKLGERGKAQFSGWLLWVFGVIAVVNLFEPYGSSWDDEEIINLVLWCVLPPLVTLGASLWVRRFVNIDARKSRK